MARARRAGQEAPRKQAAPPAAEANPAGAPPPPFAVVGIGASAGGLAAISHLLDALPPDTGMAFVVITHLSATHESKLAEILSRHTAMAVTEVHDEPEILPNTVFVIPPARSMIVADGHLKLLPRPPGAEARRPIDQFLESLAETWSYSSIGIILSGTSNDGTYGLQAVKAHGGITFAQDASAEHSGMPESAVASGIVDFILSPEAIAAELVRIGRHPHVAHPQVPAGGEEQRRMDRIVALLREVLGADFSNYKKNTLYRRITRRMLLRHMQGLEAYLQLLQQDPAELNALYHDILISVTSFFRNPEAFEALKETVFPRLIAERSNTEPVRIWSVGCSTGEEPYSLAIAWTEFAETIDNAPGVQIFASDLNQRAVSFARGGNYSRRIAQEMSAERLKRFFTETPDGYHVNRDIRERVVFAQHDALNDPPFSRVDMVSCRNVLIYLEASLQQRLIPLLHYALRPGGFLFLGSSETIGSQRALFEPVDAQHRIYARQPVEPRVAPRLPLGRGTRGTGPGGRPIRQPETGAASAAAALQNETDRILLGRYAPAGVLVNEHLDIVQFRGDTGAWLTPAAGRASFNLLKMLREGLLAPVRSAVTRARKSHEPVRETGLRVGIGDDHRDVDVEVIPVDGGPDSGHCLLVLFEPPARTQPRRGAKGAAARTTRAAEQAEGVRLGKELVATKEYLQSVIDQYEGSHDDLQAANEELQSTNEELQSVNEELETSKEEIQSSSEELATVNEELHTRNAELASSVDDMTNLVSSIQTAIVMLDRRLRIRRFTPAAEKLLNLIGTDVGRPITDIKLNVAVPDLEATAQEVMSKRTRAEFEAQDREGHWYAVRIHPFQLPDGKVDGAVLMLVDIDSLRAAEAAAGKSEERFRLLANTAPVLIWVDDAKGHRFVNRAYRDFVGGDHGEEADAPLWREYIHPDDREPYTATYDDAAGRNAPFEIQIRFRRADGEYRWMKSIAMPRTPDAEFTGYVGAKTDITDLKEAEAQLRSTDRNKNEFIAVLAHELRNPLAPLRNVVQLLQTRGLDSGMSAWAFETLARQIGNITQLVDDLLDVSRITYGKITLRNEPVDIVTAARSAIDMNRAAIGGRQQTLHVDLPETPVMMLADRLRIEQVFGNLLSNASKFTPDGGSIWLSTAVVPAKDAAGAEGRIAEIRVRDNGRGISAEELPGLFNLFTQGEESSRPPVGGLGIGLTVARRLVEMHGGTLTGSSAGRDAGAEFVARLPLPKEEIRSQEPGSRSPAARNHDGRPRRVLVVDDNTDAGDSLTLLLQLHGHEVDVVRTGETAIEMARTWRPDLVLLDINLPDRPGYEIARELREEFEREAMLIAAVTGYSGEIERLRAQESGFDHFFTKPVEIERLLAILEAQE